MIETVELQGTQEIRVIPGLSDSFYLRSLADRLWNEVSIVEILHTSLMGRRRWRCSPNYPIL